MALLPENNWEKHLENLPSYKEYIKLDNEDIKDYSDDFCVKKLESTKEEDIALCNKVSKHLKRLSGLPDNERKHGCYYFQYWLYDQISKKYSADNKINNKQVSDKLFDLVATTILKSPNLEPCRCYESGTPSVWKEEKDLHDYFKNHKDIDCTKSDKPTCEKYERYVTYINKLYEIKEYDCCDDDDLLDPLCEPYINCKSQYRPDDLLTKLKKDLKALEAKEKEVLKAVGGGDAPGAVVVNKAAGRDVPGSGRPGSDGPGSEKNAPGIAGAEEGKDLPAKPVAAKPVAAKPVAAKPAEEEPLAAKPAAAESGGSPPEVAKPPATVSGGTESGVGKPADVKPEGVEQRAVLKPEVGKEETVGPAQQEAPPPQPSPRAPAPTEPKETLDEPQVPEGEVDKEEPEETAAEDGVDEVAEVAEEEEAGPLEGEETVILQDTATVSAPSVQDSGAAVHVAPYYTPELAGNGAPLTNVDAPSAVGTIHEELDSNFFRNVIMAVAVLGTIFFLFYYNRSSQLESSYRKKKKKKGKIFEHNYYEEYEKELEMYGSEETFLDSETDRLYLNYHPDQDSYY
ncbi:variable surface protein Vir12-related [Plasmodium vivax]|uniref:Variable surface protein Vir12-related n=1 Tax=Plasmodium vivax (strain Salvador I) TaxID=126793 RepID=A5KD74_PLAVS|nr:variable surface protein Vir12-related [Plasmodium vivax]EDL42695.1 variable surface protein Vir12-related [Plasmodium vivax]|eukprot:XP_001612488.1 variable surface protein Vir12-related [Plasmodium vivax Sal-1]